MLLKASRRKKRPRIFCLQMWFFAGYGFVFKKRTGLRTDGCAFYYRQSVFNLEDYITVEYCQPNVTLLDRDNIAIVAVLSPKDKPEEKFVVATTHLLYNPRRQDIRVAQTQVLLAEVERMSFKELNKEYVKGNVYTQGGEKFISMQSTYISFFVGNFMYFNLRSLMFC